MAQTALSPHALHVHPLRPEGSTRFVRASGSPVHSSGSLVTTMGGTVRLVNRVDKSDKIGPKSTRDQRWVGDNVPRGPPAYGLVRSELPHRKVVLRAAPALWVLVFPMDA